MATNFEFIISDPASNPKPGKSLQIRSRCMQGKNKREGSRRSLREKKRLTKTEQEQEEAVVQQIEQPDVPQIPPPRPLIGDLALVRFAGPDIDLEAKGLLFRTFAYNVANQALSPFDSCVDFDCIESVSFEWFFSDSAFLHSVLCASYAAVDSMDPAWDGRPSHKTVFYLRKSLSLLQAKMCNEYVHQDESALHAVLILALLASMYNDWKAAAAHWKGLNTIIGLKGHLEFLKRRPKLHFKLDRWVTPKCFSWPLLIFQSIDLTWALSSGKKPFFLDSTLSWDPIVPVPYPPLCSGLYQPSADWDFRLANIFCDLQHLSLSINRKVLERTRYDARHFQGILTSLQSRLISLGDQLENPVQELVRLTMLAFLTTTFKAPGRTLPFGWVVKQLPDAYANATSSLIEQDQSLHLWLLMTAAFTVSGVQENWVRKAWDKAASGFDWVDVKSHLMRVVWVETIHDKSGEVAFQQLKGQTLVIDLD